MRKKKDSDHSMTTPEEAAVITPEAAQSDEATTPKVRSGIFGIVAIFSSLVLILIAFINPFHTNGQYLLDTNTDITIRLNLSSENFLVLSNKNVCDGSGSTSGIKTSTAYAKAKNLDVSRPLGSGQLNDEGECEYVITIPTTDSFQGGSVDFSFKFPFGNSKVFPIKIGDKAPYVDAIINIPLD